MEKKKKILLVEDDESMGFLLKDSLENYDFEVTHFTNGKTALAEFSISNFDLCLLDVMMPNMDGFSLATEIRNLNIDVPIVFLTAKSMKEDRIKGFKIGADDYVTKPFSVEELMLRIHAILKRGNVITPDNKIISFSFYELDVSNLILKTPSKSIELSQKETDVLAFIATNKNRLIKRDAILNSVWKDNSYFVSRSLDVFLSKLRKHFKEDESIKIKNVHGLGYKFIVKETF